MLSSYLPEILSAFLGGAVADRSNRKMLMLLSDFVSALCTLFYCFCTARARCCHGTCTL